MSQSLRAIENLAGHTKDTNVAVDPTAVTDPVSEPSSTVPRVRRDPATGLFTSDGNGADLALRGEVEAFEASLVEALGPEPGPGRRALAHQAAVAYALARRLEKGVEAYGAISRAGRVRAAVRELERWQERLTELLALLGLDKPKPVDPMAALRAHMDAVKKAAAGDGDDVD